MNKIDKDFDDLVDDIKLEIDGTQAGTGFHEIHCPMCGNTGKKKGGFKFETDMIIYNCFRGRCTATTVYEKGEFVPRKFKELMKELGIKIPPTLLVAGRKKNKLFADVVDERFKKHVYKEMRMPSGLVPLEGSNGWNHFSSVINRRKVLSDGFLYQTEGDFRGSMAIPIYFFDKLIGIEYYTRQGKYFTKTINEHVIFSKDKYLPKKILVVEGMFDALCFPNTVASKRSKMSPEQAYQLRGKDVVVLPDRLNSKLYETAKEYGWKVCIPMWEEKDLNEFVMNKGLLVAAERIKEYTMTVGTQSEVLYKQWRVQT